MTRLSKTVSRVSRLTTGHGRKMRFLVVSLVPHTDQDYITFRPAGCRYTYTVPLVRCYNLAVLNEANKRRAERAAQRRAKK